MTWYYNPATGHYVYSAVDPGAPWILQSPTLSIYSIAPIIGSAAGGD